MAPPFPPASLPPATAEFTHVVQPAHPDASPQQTASRMFRSADGKTRVDSGNTSLITDPTAGRTILLDHAAKQARVMPAPQMAPPQPGQPPPPPGMPGFALPAAPSAPPPNVKDLGKSVINGHEVEGKQFTYPTPSAPGAPAAPAPPGMPHAPALPGMPSAAPKPPGMPSPPPLPPTVAEVWTSTKMGLPMLTKMSGPFGQSSTSCHSATPGEPNPAVFQIPHDYKQV